jgi:site-specific DNA-cytosine methylase
LPSHRKDNVDIAEELPTVIAFCAGYGGIERGLDLAGLEHRVIAYVEIEAFAIANLVNKMEAGQLPPAPIYTDLKTFPAHLFRDRVDLITGGYPCQPFSAAGQRKGTDDPRHLWPYILDHIRSIRPVQCFFENVEGHISLGLSTVISDLEEDGYRATWGIFSAREVGAPHQRKRVYILGNSEHYGSSTSEIRGGASSTSNNTTQGQNEAIKSQRASQPDCGGDLSGAADMGHSQNNRCAGCRETIKRERSENHIKRPDQDLRWQSQRSSQTLADTEGKFSKRRTAARDHKGASGWGRQERKGFPEDSLPNAVTNWPTPSAHEARLGYQDRSDTTKKGTQESLLTVVVNTAGGRSECPGHLNPDWVEWLMGVPTGWTELGSWEMQ